MARTPKVKEEVQVEYTGKVLKAYEKMTKLEADYKAAKDEFKKALKEQKEEERIAKEKAEQAARESLIKAVEKSGKTMEEVLAFLGVEEKSE